MELTNQIKTTKTDSNHKPTKFNIGFDDGDRNNNSNCELNPITFGDYDYKSTNQSENSNEKCQFRLNEEQNASIEKQNAIINFSVERILNSSPKKSRLCVNDLNQTTFEMSSNTKFATLDSEYGKVHRPLPVRYMPNNNNVPFPGFALNNIPVSLRRCHLKYPFSHYYHHITPTRSVGQRFDVEHILATNPLPFSHLQHSHHRSDCLVDPTNPKITSIPPPSVASSGNNATGGQTKRKRSWSRAVFSQLQRKGLEIQFQIQKYITKPDRRKLAARLGLTDAQVKVWFQNRRMKWRHTRETKLDKSHERKMERKMESTVSGEVERDYLSDSSIDSDSCSSDEGKHVIDVVTE